MSNAVRELDDAALVHRLLSEERNLVGLRFRHSRGQLENTAKLAVSRREIARLATELRRREIEGGLVKGGLLAKHQGSFVAGGASLPEARKGAFLSSVVDKLSASE